MPFHVLRTVYSSSVDCRSITCPAVRVSSDQHVVMIHRIPSRLYTMLRVCTTAALCVCLILSVCPVQASSLPSLMSVRLTDADAPLLSLQQAPYEDFSADAYM